MVPIRNFCIIAHIDHGKSTLADRFLEKTGALDARKRVDQYLDRMEIERERGITIKAQAVRLVYRSRNGVSYQLNLIDTPGHVDFHYEVSRALCACEGALLVVDATQGIQAQTVANALAAMEQQLHLIPVINKIDLPNADVARVSAELVETFGFRSDEMLAVSAKTGAGIEAVLEAIVARCPAPPSTTTAPLRALLIDSWFDNYQGVIMLVRVVDGSIRVGERVQLMATGRQAEVLSLGVFAPEALAVPSLNAGEVGFLITGIREVRETQIGDTVTVPDAAVPALAGFRPAQAIVFAGIFPTDAGEYEALRTALEKLRLNDASFHFEPETSVALGFGFRCGFLGSLHLEIIQERLEREYDVSLISTAPTVAYRITAPDGQQQMISNPAEFPQGGEAAMIEEPYAALTIHAPAEFIGNILTLCEERRGEQEGIDYFGTDRVAIRYQIPFAELICHFHDQLKSVTRGYASLEYDLHGYRQSQLVKLTVAINGDPVDALSVIVHQETAYYRGREIVEKLREVIPRQMFDVAVQAAIGGRVIARETVKALRKNVTAKCYGGDITRKRKLLEKQKEGKKRMKRVGRVDLPQEAFLSILKVRSR
ncbi:MAG: elongation factor 4 [Deltaproteobacteria bacterium]|nr:elongation factor 4 [Deltaproteobacteria bacterium]